MEEKYVFLSRPNPFRRQHKDFIAKLQEYLSQYDIKTITLQAANYDITDSIDYIVGLIKQCFGIIIVGFSQIHIKQGWKKKCAEKLDDSFESKEEKLKDTKITSPFCHIEGTIGKINNLPMLIIKEKGVRVEGLLQESRFSISTDCFDLDEIDDFFKSKTVREQISVWTGEVNKLYLFLNKKKV